MPRRALFIINRKSRQGRSDLNAVRERLTAHGLTLQEEKPRHPADISPAIRRHAPSIQLVILGGGDGTLHHALEGLLDTKLPLGIVPLGTANDLARTLNLPSDPLEACDVIARGETQQIDLGCVNGRHFFNVASIGLAVQVTRRLTRETKSRWGVLAYLIAAVQALLRMRRFAVEIHHGEAVHHTRTVQITVGNGRHYGGGLRLEEARINDGELFLYSLEIERWWHILPLVPALLRGTFTPMHSVQTHRGSAFFVKPVGRQHHITADGELIGQTPAQFRVLPRAVTVFAPAPEQ